VETLTNQLEEKAMDYIDKIDSMGGVYEAIERGFFQKEIADSAYKYQKEIDGNERTLVSVNKYCIEEPECPIELLRVDPAVEEQQISRLEKLRRARNKTKVKQALSKLHDEADKNSNLMPTIIETVKAYATLGEICSVLRGVYGEYKELIVI